MVDISWLPLSLATSAQFLFGDTGKEDEFRLSLPVGAIFLATWSCDFSWANQKAPQDS